MNDAQAMRDAAMSAAMQRKEEFLGARVPKELRDKVIRRAEHLNVPVSILIRTILEEAMRDSPDTPVTPPASEDTYGYTPPYAGYPGPGPAIAAARARPAPMPPIPAPMAPPPPPPEAMRSAPRFPSVLGWEDIRLNRTMNCSSCGVELTSGMNVALGVGTARDVHVVLCTKCRDRV